MLFRRACRPAARPHTQTLSHLTFIAASIYARSTTCMCFLVRHCIYPISFLLLSRQNGRLWKRIIEDMRPTAFIHGWLSAVGMYTFLYVCLINDRRIGFVGLYRGVLTITMLFYYALLRGHEKAATKSGKKTDTKTTSSAYCRDFEQKLEDHGVYLDGFEHMDELFPEVPKNMDEIQNRLLRLRRSLSHTIFTEDEFCSLAVTKPDHFFGARPGRLKPKILQSYGLQERLYDKNAYTITSIYQGGQLKLYTTHLNVPSPRSKGRPEYIMTLLRSFAMMDTLDTFRQGVTAYRNARDWPFRPRLMLDEEGQNKAQGGSTGKNGSSMTLRVLPKA
ncbi:hypothetical protein MGYG_03777 [Nannizzia gypsea CBS 118893]|uniref:Uncharacterized protein n=1 Tax=Arthroderma gypseum (strain ATCC MYA-4604 / CBS 118893) TaxID=535722 RepID=E4UTW8_ARTGP|nr:hypothetical protein MGYG_03777 [Nannizzia gypsea CBS 118893]EFR00774.1 hypothetical protein MGYG_03777 [Nannizzia gypsea CBS 118893]